ncbi:MAG: MerR family transcriptional regulator [Sarcina sp.]
MNEDVKYYKIKEIADKAGVTIRTLRYYDNIGLLKPSFKNELNYRFYTDEDLVILQKIISLKFLDFSISEIEEIMNSNNDKQVEMLINKKKLLEQKIKQLNFINNALEKVESDLEINTNSDIDWCVIANEIKVSRIKSHKVSCGKEIKDMKNHKLLHGELIESLIELSKTKKTEKKLEILSEVKTHMDKMISNDKGLDLVIEILRDLEDMPGQFKGLKSSDAKSLIELMENFKEGKEL